MLVEAKPFLVRVVHFTSVAVRDRLRSRPARSGILLRGRRAFISVSPGRVRSQSRTATLVKSTAPIWGLKRDACLGRDQGFDFYIMTSLAAGPALYSPQGTREAAGTGLPAGAAAAL